jgi:hypothetical protein
LSCRTTPGRDAAGGRVWSRVAPAGGGAAHGRCEGGAGVFRGFRGGLGVSEPNPWCTNTIVCGALCCCACPLFHLFWPLAQAPFTGWCLQSSLETRCVAAQAHITATGSVLVVAVISSPFFPFPQTISGFISEPGCRLQRRVCGIASCRGQGKGSQSDEDVGLSVRNFLYISYCVYYT